MVAESEAGAGAALPTPKLAGVHHTARPTWKLAETIHFYREVMGLQLCHAISARGWGPADHPDFLHFFFKSGEYSTIAFFYYLKTDKPHDPIGHDHWLYRSVHTAWQVRSEAELLAWRERFERQGYEIMQVRHELIESIYVTDPNGYLIEISRQVRPMTDADALDATLTIEAALAVEADLRKRVETVDEIWRAKARRVKAHIGDDEDTTPKAYVLDVPEFRGLADSVRSDPAYKVVDNLRGYLTIEGPEELVFHRRATGFKPAIWYGALTGGIDGEIAEFGPDEVRVVARGAK